MIGFRIRKGGSNGPSKARGIGGTAFGYRAVAKRLLVVINRERPKIGNQIGAILRPGRAYAH
jgi:hypothetical protein